MGGGSVNIVPEEKTCHTKECAVDTIQSGRVSKTSVTGLLLVEGDNKNALFIQKRTCPLLPHDANAWIRHLQRPNVTKTRRFSCLEEETADDVRLGWVVPARPHPRTSRLCLHLKISRTHIRLTAGMSAIATYEH